MADQRKRTGLTSEYEEWLRQQLARLSAESNDGSLSSPPLTKYADIEDPRAGRTGLGKPIGSFLDALVRPGRVAQMDADQRALQDKRMQYAEQRPMIQAQTSALMTDNQLEKLKLLALEGDADAQNLLGKYTQLLSPRAGGGGLDYGMLTGAMGQGPGGTKVARKQGAGGDTGGGAERSPRRSPILSGQLTLANARKKATAEIADRKRKLEMLDAEEADINTEGSTRSVPTYATGGSMGGSPYQTGTRDIPIDMLWRARRSKEIPEERAAIQADIQQLENVLTEISGPITSPSSAAEQIIR
tara:strand:+ start:1453 stop:2355 length:903 start_codon:yes stop_codon:yes gene_type:complete